MRTLLGCLAVLLFLFQYVTLAKLQVASASVSYLSFSRFRAAMAEAVPFDALDGVLAGLIVGLCLAVLGLEIRGRRLTRFLRPVFASPWQTGGLLLASGAVFGRFYLPPGEFNWAADSPRTSPTPTSPPAPCSRESCRSGPTRWAPARPTCSSTASCSSGSPALPRPLWGLERSLRLRRRALLAAPAGGVALGLLILAHPGYGYWACAFTALYALARVACARPVDGSGAAIRVAALLGVAVAVGAALVLPMWLDRVDTGLGRGYSLLAIPDPRWWHVLVWSNFRFWLLPPTTAEYHW